MSNLAGIAKQGKSGNPFRASTFGVVIDSTRPYKTQAANDYVTKIKMIDEGYNPKLTEGGFRKHRKFFHLFIYTHRIEDAPEVGSIGDIVRLSRFEFKRFSNNGVVEMQGKSANMDKTSNWLVYSGTDEDDFAPINGKNTTDSEMRAAERKRLVELREWTRSFFLTSSCKKEILHLK